MEGMIEALVGCKAGETKMVPVTFPIRPSGPGAALSGKEALFQVEVHHYPYTHTLYSHKTTEELEPYYALNLILT